MHRRVDHQNPAWREAGEHPVGAEDDLVHVAVAGHADADDLGSLGEGSWTARGRRGGVREGVESLRPSGPERQWESGVRDPASYRPPLAAEADEADGSRRRHHKTNGQPGALSGTSSIDPNAA